MGAEEAEAAGTDQNKSGADKTDTQPPAAAPGDVLKEGESTGDAHDFGGVHAHAEAPVHHWWQFWK
jgi:hypothetical protein